jgi:ABC-2 type transport system permease protein
VFTLINTEKLKLITVRSTWLLLALAQLAIVIGASGRIVRGAKDSGDIAIGAVAHVGLVSLFALVAGIVVIAGEYRHRTITDTYLTTPRRGRVIAAKMVVATAAGIAFGLAGAVTAVLTTGIGMALKGAAVDWWQAELWRTLGGDIVWNAAFAAIGVAIGALIRNLAAAIAAALAWIALVEGLIGQLVGSRLHDLLPFSAGEVLGRLPMATGSDTAPPQWAAAAILIGYAVVLCLAAVTTTIRRDVA